MKFNHSNIEFYKNDFLNIDFNKFNKKYDLILSDIAPNTTGHKSTDHLMICSYVYDIIDILNIIANKNSSFVTKIWKGFEEFYDLGLLNGKVNTHMHLAQPEGCSPIVSAWNEKSPQIIPVKPNTVAHSLAIGNPADGIYALKLIKESDGSAIAVPESEISEGIKLLAETEGIFTETAGGVVISSLQNLVKEKRIKKSESVIAFITGNGLKTQEVVESVVNPIEISPTFSEIENIYRKLT